MKTQPVPRDSTLDVELSGFRDIVTGDYPTSASGSLTLNKPDGSALISGIAVTRDPTTSGAATIYRGEIADTVGLEDNTTYEAVLTVTISGKKRTFRATVPVTD